MTWRHLSPYLRQDSNSFIFFRHCYNYNKIKNWKRKHINPIRENRLARLDSRSEKYFMAMGCSTSSSAVPESNKDRTLSGNNKINDKARSTKRDEQRKTKYPASEAFIIPLNDEIETKVYVAGAPEVNDQLAATVRKQPPKRIQELIEQANRAESETAAANLQNLEEKLEKAEERRKEFLQQKITNIQKSAQILMQSGSNKRIGKEEEDEKEEVKTHVDDEKMGKTDNLSQPQNTAKK